MSDPDVAASCPVTRRCQGSSCLQALDLLRSDLLSCKDAFVSVARRPGTSWLFTGEGAARQDEKHLLTHHLQTSVASLAALLPIVRFLGFILLMT